MSEKFIKEFGERTFDKDKYLIVSMEDNLVKVVDYKYDSIDEAKEVISLNPKWRKVEIISDERYSQLWNNKFNIESIKRFYEKDNTPFNRLLKIIDRFMFCDGTEVSSIKISDEVYNTLYNNLGFDSLDEVELVMDIESEFDVRISTENENYIIDNKLSFGEAIKYLNLK